MNECVSEPVSDTVSQVDESLKLTSKMINLKISRNLHGSVKLDTQSKQDLILNQECHDPNR